MKHIERYKDIGKENYTLVFTYDFQFCNSHILESNISNILRIFPHYIEICKIVRKLQTCIEKDCYFDKEKKRVEKYLNHICKYKEKCEDIIQSQNLDPYIWKITDTSHMSEIRLGDYVFVLIPKKEHVANSDLCTVGQENNNDNKAMQEGCCEDIC